MNIGQPLIAEKATPSIQEEESDTNISEHQKSVLILGPPGSGKTTIIRDVARELSKVMLNVVVVDTSNEICGDGLIPHFSVGMARRMMVPNLDEQADILVEAVQNHTPDVIICDEIGRKKEVTAIRTVKERGVRCISSAHGNLRGLGKSTDINYKYMMANHCANSQKVPKLISHIVACLNFSKKSIAEWLSWWKRNSYAW